MLQTRNMQSNNQYSVSKGIDFCFRTVDKNVKPSGVLNLIQQAGDEHSILLGLDSRSLIKQNKTWVLTRLKFEIYRSFAQTESVVVTTWPIKPRRLETDRDTKIFSQNGELLVSAVAKWSILDFVNRTICDTSNVVYEMELLEDRALDNKFNKIKFRESFVKVGSFTVTRSKLDVNNHMNNIFYADVLYDYLPEKWLLHNYSFSVVYCKECKLNDKLSVFVEETEEYFCLILLNQTEETAVNMIVKQI